MKFFFSTIAICLLSSLSLCAQPITGLSEVCIGTRDELAQIRYWQRFGFRVGPTGELSAAQALQLYGVNSRLRAIRLLHQDSDHGFVRLLIWDQPTSVGLQLAPMKTLGNRWSAQLTNDLFNAYNHVEAAQTKGLPISFIAPQLNVMPLGAPTDQPLVDVLFAIRDFVVLQPETRQVLFQRWGYTRPLYGKVNETALLQASQITHAGLVTNCDQSALDFYDQTLGLLRTENNQRSDHTNPVARNLFALQPHESYSITSFDDPRSSTDFAKMRSGRLIIFRFPKELNLPDQRATTRPGALGLSLYTLRVNDLAAYHVKLKASAATNVTAIVNNEFGERSFSFVAPDGYFWTLIESKKPQ